MRKLLRYAVIIVFILALILLWISYSLANDKGYEFWSNLLLNLVAELLGLVLAVKVATILADKKLDELAPRLVTLIGQLRKAKRIEGETARSCVICAVGLISEDRLSQNRATTTMLGSQDCDVCGQDALIDRNSDGDVHCKYCGLHGDIWEIKVKEAEKP